MSHNFPSNNPSPTPQQTSSPQIIRKEIERKLSNSSTFDIVNLNDFQEVKEHEGRKEVYCLFSEPWLIRNLRPLHSMEISLSERSTVADCVVFIRSLWATDSLFKVTICNKKCKLISWEMIFNLFLLFHLFWSDRHFIKGGKFLSKALLNNFIVHRHHLTILGKQSPEKKSSTARRRIEQNTFFEGRKRETNWHRVRFIIQITFWACNLYTSRGRD